ncbi:MULTISPECIES: S1/P1 nuclease [unclassified Bradyrhizobium]|uniref:S1/P1 nuclease n=1 Tax=unclassified Bradyrhizobium TaxID=2631580 RepID=UPI002916D522|nr:MULTISPECIES: S1/P1 nuclease [unclassified Bradyrhizobium]
MRVLSLATIIWAALCGQAAAWGDEGHKIVCEIAFRLAQPDTRAAVRKLIKSGTEFDTFADSCIFPDHPRIHPPRHFLNLPRDGKPLTTDDCGGASECVVTAILNDAENVASKASKTADRLIALKSLGHWVGDVHQPLHVSFADDRGGNNIDVSGACSRNLHSAWDNCLVVHAVGPDVKLAADKLLDAITNEQIAEWNASDPHDWANESFAISEAAETGYCTFHGKSCYPPDSGSVTIDPAYLAKSDIIIRERLQKAGVRLAHLLDSIFAD